MNGPILAAYNVADDLGWAHFGCLQKLLMILNGVKSLRDKGYMMCVQGFCGYKDRVSESLRVSMRLCSQMRQRQRRKFKGLWICKSKVKTKLRKLLQTLRVFYSRGSVALGKYSYTKVSHEELRHSLKGLVHVS
jgi:hypothetical protein